MASVVERMLCVKWETRPEMLGFLSSRYYKLNALAFLRHGTLEFRQHGGTMSILRMVNWIIFCVNFIENSRMSPEEIAVFNERKAAYRLDLVASMISQGDYPASWDIAYDVGIRPSMFAELLNELGERYPAFAGSHVHIYSIMISPEARAMGRTITPRRPPCVGPTDLFQGLPRATAAHFRTRISNYARPRRSRAGTTASTPTV
jgi:hypothetical protein